ncbi:unnamed protein product [Larinioides sclopetarius]|uniref:Uncharacterized protein n=1 Tax=Larinioides sclopetarius TaxID=280406 RepID=A0AAV2AEM6_9ARAC
MTVSFLTVERVVSVIMRVLQSKDKITLEDGFRVDCITIRRDIGAGKTNNGVFNSRSRLPSQDICCDRASDGKWIMLRYGNCLCHCTFGK